MRALVVLTLAGCWHEVPPPPVVPSTDGSSTVANDDLPTTRRHRRPAGPDCSSLGPAMERLFNNSGLQNQLAPILEAVTASCTEDGWSTDLVQCFIDANDDRHVQQCAMDLLSPQQMESLQRRLMSVMAPSVQPPSPPSP